ncbi:hydrogenase [Methanobrevibacter sp. 87.7]|uniref:energy conserving hydrogenase EhbF n=1 Tax=Methanobrevibacter sp. 87.7 TaxID=387957 RepID=UPI000B50E95D|nr:energy conserving hydrogenase EhbF [Methanobrevibacter sp. 87.7]OWT33137.1 hydrogenase [Methanobrevibacter sp. 87.7]
MNYLIPLMVIFPIFAALLINLFGKHNKTIKILSFIVAIILPLITLFASYGLHFFGGHKPLIDTNITGLPTYITSTNLYSMHPAITYSFTPLTKVFIFIMCIIVFLSVFSYLTSEKKASGSFLFLVFMGTAAVSAMILSDDLFNMYVFFEIAALVQTGIVIASKAEDNYETALKYMILGSIGGPMLLLGITILLAITGSVNITDIAIIISTVLIKSPISKAVVLFSFALILFGWLYASGFPPFHVIKSSLYSKSESYGSSILQAMSLLTLVAFLIAMARMFYLINIFNGAILIVSIIAMILGVSMAVMQTDFRRMIAYLSVGELGFVGLGFGLGTKFSMTAGLFQGINEMIVTALLFLGLGSVVYLTNTSNIRKLGGLISKSESMAIMVLLGGFAMAGVPPFNGFRSKFMIIHAALLAGYPEVAVIAILISIATFFVFVKALHGIYLKPQPNDLEFVHDSIPKSVIFSVAVLTIMCLILGLYPEIVTVPISQALGGLII